ncbi:MAG: hypothetical protein Q4E07_07080 [Eubacteriales bacterium]|nr:hypothetical protein [Eubacteriales bacterium]
MARNEVFALVDQISLSLQNAKKVPLTNLVMVDQGSLSDLLKRIVASYDPQLEKADIILSKEKNIIDEANAGAEKTRAEADAQAQAMVNEANSYAQNTRASADAYAAETAHQAEESANAVMADAKTRAEQMLEDAKARADELVSETTVLARAQAQAEELLTNANEHAAALEHQTQQDLINLLSQIESSLRTKNEEVSMMLENVKSMQMYSQENRQS